MVEELGTTFGRFVTADCDRDGLCVRDYMWIKIGIDIYQPLRKGIQILPWEGEEHVVAPVAVGGATSGGVVKRVDFPNPDLGRADVEVCLSRAGEVGLVDEPHFLLGGCFPLGSGPNSFEDETRSLLGFDPFSLNQFIYGSSSIIPQGLGATRNTRK
ncbi:hypothetical protein COP2_033075 [Malus domestica]